MEREHDVDFFLFLFFVFLVFFLVSLIAYVVAEDYERSSDRCSYLFRSFKDIQCQGLSLHRLLPMIVCRRVALSD